MFRISLLFAVVLFVGLSCEVYAQDAGQRTRELVTALDKTKYKKKEKANISIEVYVDIKNEAAVREDPTAYSGNYGSEEYRMTLSVAKDGSVTGDGYDVVGENMRRMNFTLRDARIQGALLTGTKVYEGGSPQPFEGVFTNRTVSTGKNVNQIDSRETLFGFGFIQTNGSWTNRVFLERR
ncbi:MAG TPA: hypothetical protein VMZ26_17415 [Pyrinomonadaceae bacterium]|nr:hypothetical protein [Pyrinomonadaceae bacterium]